MFALTFIASLVVVTVVSFVFMRSAEKSFFAFLFGGIGLTIALIASACGLGMSFDWFASEHKARILNAEYGTQYTRQDIFFASSVIDTIKHLDRKRIELNGDILKEEAKK